MVIPYVTVIHVAIVNSCKPSTNRESTAWYHILQEAMPTCGRQLTDVPALITSTDRRQSRTALDAIIASLTEGRKLLVVCKYFPLHKYINFILGLSISVWMFVIHFGLTILDVLTFLCLFIVFV